ncbi:MAG: FIST N-terminal domain-containing protein, partial [Candidatus Auribacterota bacterium]|nr:FIST N-terminal domain-containing protein [Candidatus Auribacterota bacterium]
MNLTLGIGFSQHDNIEQAATEAAKQAKIQAGSGRIDMALLLTTPQYDPQTILPIIENTIPHTRIIGGTTAGIIVEGALHRYGIAIFAFHSNTVKIQTIHAHHLNLKNLIETGSAFVKETGPLFGQKDQKFLLFFFDGLIENMSEFNFGIQKELGEYFPVIGAGNSDQLLFSKTVQYHDKAAASNSACGAIFGGDISLHMARRHGWKPLGKPRLIKKAKKNIIEKIGSSPPIQLYEELFKDNLGSLKNDAFGKLNARYPLGIFVKKGQEYIIRNVLDILEDGSFVCQDHVQEGSEVHLMIGNK